MEKKSQPNIKKNFLYSTFYQVLCLITPFITSPYISRVLGSSGVGIYSYTNSIAAFFIMFASLGVSSYGEREIARNRDDINKRSKLFYEIELLVILTTTVVTIAWLILAFFYKKYSLYLFVLTIQIFGTAFDITWFFGGLEQYHYVIKKNSICKLLCVISIFIFVKSKEHVWIYILIIVLSCFLGNISTWLALPKLLVRVDKKELCIKRHFKETLVYFIPTIATSIYTILDKTMIGLITDDNSMNGYYESATKIVNMGKTFAFVSINGVMQARMSYLFSNNDIDEIHSKIDTTLEYILFMSVAISFGIAGIAKGFVPWFFGEDFLSMTSMLIMLSPIILIIGISNCIGSLYYTPAGFRKQSTRYLIVGSITNLILNSILIPLYSGYGAIIGSLAAESVITILYVKNAGEYFNFSILFKKMWKKMLAGIIMLIVLFLLRNMEPSIINTIIQIMIGGLTYCIILLVLKDEFVVKIIKRGFEWLNSR